MENFNKLFEDMKLTTLIVIIIVVFIITWTGSSMMNVHNAKNKKGIILSPDKSKSVEFINAMSASQVLLIFHKNLIVSGSNIMSGNFTKEDMRIVWNGDNNLVIDFPNCTKFNVKEDEIHFFGEIVKVKYVERSEK